MNTKGPTPANSRLGPSLLGVEMTVPLTFTEAIFATVPEESRAQVVVLEGPVELNIQIWKYPVKAVWVVTLTVDMSCALITSGPGGAVNASVALWLAVRV